MKKLIQMYFQHRHPCLKFSEVLSHNIHIYSWEYNSMNIEPFFDLEYDGDNKKILYLLTEYNSLKDLLDEAKKLENIIEPIDVINARMKHTGFDAHVKFMSHMTISSNDIIEILERNKSVYVPDIIIIDRSKYIYPHNDFQTVFSSLEDICEKYKCSIVIRHILKKDAKLSTNNVSCIVEGDTFLHYAQLYNSTKVHTL